MFVRSIARPLLASIFVSEGIDTLRNPGPRVEAAEPVIDLIAEAARPAAQKAADTSAGAVSQATRSVESAAQKAAGKVDETAARAVMTADALGEPATTASDTADAVSDKVGETAGAVRATVHGVASGEPLPFATETYVKVNAGVQLGAGLLLASGKAPRLASAALAATLVPTTLAGHRFWEMEDGADRKNQQIHFMKNVSLLGGLILASVDTAGQPGIAWRARHLGQETAVAAKAARANAAVAAQATAANAKAAKRLAAANAKVAKANAKAGRKAGRNAGKAAGKVGAATAATAGTTAAVSARKAAELARHEAKVAGALARKGWETTQARSEVVLPEVKAKAAELTSHAQALGARMAERLPASA